MRETLLHLRFPFVYVLAPIFVWGAWWAPAGWTGRTTLAFLLVHLCLYPGANAFNSAYDRDSGPIGGLARPPAVPAGLARWSAVLQAVGAALAFVVGLWFAAAYVLLWGVFSAYSHPRTRWKRSAWRSTPAIVLGQGGLGFWLGWSAAGPRGADPLAAARAAPATFGWALVGACAAVAALYPLTQVYQRDEDARRADRTLAAALGVRGTFAWCAAGLAIVALATRALGLATPAAFAATLGAAGLGVALVAPPDWTPSHRLVMAVAYLFSTVFLATSILRWT